MNLTKYTDIAVGNPRGTLASVIVATKWEYIINLMKGYGISREKTERLYYDMVWGLGMNIDNWNPFSVSKYIPGIEKDQYTGYPNVIIFFDNLLEQIFFEASLKISS